MDAGTFPHAKDATARVDPKYPLQELYNGAPANGASANGIVRDRSRKRRSAGAGQGNRLSQPEQFPVLNGLTHSSRGPPISYRDPDETSNTEFATAPKSFAARVNDLASGGVSKEKLEEGQVAQHDEPAQPATRQDVPSHSFEDAPREPEMQMRPAPLQPERDFVRETASQRRRSTKLTTRSNDAVPDSDLIPARLSGRHPESAKYDAKAREMVSKERPVPIVEVTAAPRNSRPQSKRDSNPQKIEVAADRSPLQKLEVKLTDLSKEEKRAKVQEAERRLKERKKAQQRESLSKEVKGEAADRRSVSQIEAKERPRDAALERHRSLGRSDSRHASAPVNAPFAPQDHDLDDSGFNRSYSKRRSSGSSQVAQDETPLRKEPPLSRIPRPVSVSKTQTPLGITGSSSQRERTSMDSAALRPPALETSAERRRGGGVAPNAVPARRRSTDDRGVRFDNDPAVATVGGQGLGSQASRHVVPHEQENLYAERLNIYGGEDTMADPTSAHAAVPNNKGPIYKDSPQTDAGIQARRAIGFGSEQKSSRDTTEAERHHFMQHFQHHNDATQGQAGGVTHSGHHLLHQNNSSHKAAKMFGDAPLGPRHLDEWRQGGTARLMLADASRQEADAPKDKKSAWWESPKSAKERLISNQGRPKEGYLSESNDAVNGMHCPPKKMFITMHALSTCSSRVLHMR